MSLDFWDILKKYEILRLTNKTSVVFYCQSHLVLESHIQFRDCDIDVEHIGSYTYLGGQTSVFRYIKSIGRFCAIAGNIRTGEAEHPTNLLSTHSMFHFSWENVWPSISSHYKKNKDFFLKAAEFASLDVSNRSSKIIIGNDVWIGYGVFIRRGVTIGDGAIIGAHSVVTKDIPPYSVAVGNPIKIIRSRFSEKIIERLLLIKWWDYGLAALDGVDISDIYSAIPHIEDNIVKLQPWIPKKIELKLNKIDNKLSVTEI